MNAHDTYQVLIVDDEEKDRSLVRTLLQRQYQDRFTFLEARDAAEAGSLLDREPVDLMIADIHMPGANGLTLARDLQGEDKQVYVIILTAYNYFEYAKDAIRYQVNDFILKPPIRQELYDAIERFFSWAQSRKNPQRMDEVSRSVVARELGECIMLNAERKKIDVYRDLLGIREDQVFCILIDTSSSKNLKAASFQDEIEAAVNSLGIPYAVSHMHDRTAIFCFTGQDSRRYDNLSITVDLKMHLSLELCEKANIAVGGTVSVYDTPRDSYRQAVTQLDSHPARDLWDTSIEDQLSDDIKNGQVQEARQKFSHYLLNYGEQHNIDDLMLKDIEILTVIRKSLQIHENQVHLKMVDIFSTGSMEDIVRFSGAYLQELAEKSTFDAAPKRHYAVQQICRRVEEHVEMPWSINDLAREYGFNPFYLSRLFKEETRLCFTDYLTEKRVEKAIALMSDTSLTIGEIGLAVGYNDQNYFSRVFKKRTHLGPKDYRRQRSSVKEG